MLTLKSNVDFGASFQKLAASLLYNKMQGNWSHEDVSYALGNLSSAVKLHIKECTIEEEINDIPDELFASSASEVKKEGIAKHDYKKEMNSYATAIANLSGHPHGSAIWFQVYNETCRSINLIINQR